MRTEEYQYTSANEKRIFNTLKQTIYSTTTQFYRQGNTRLTLQDRLLIDYYAGKYTGEIMEALKNVTSKK